MADHPRTRLEQIMKDRGTGPTEFAREFNRRADTLGLDTSVSQSTLYRWFSGSEKPRPVSRKVLEAWFGETATSLFGRPHTAPAKLNVEEMIMTSARRSTEHALDTAVAALDSIALEHLQEQVEHAARKFSTTPTLELLPSLVATRDRVYQQLDRTHKPRQMAELYLIAGQVCGLISSASLDLGYADSAEEQARAALTYGRYIEHSALEGWARALLATAAYWSGRPRKAIQYAADGLSTTVASPLRAQLHSMHARALGQVGAHEEVETHLRKASDELERDSNDAAFEEIGGELRFDQLRFSVCAASAYLALGDGRKAEIASSDAIYAYTQVTEEERAGVLAARADLSSARVLCGDLAGAWEAIGPVLETKTSRRTERLTQRAIALSQAIGAPQFHAAREAQDLGQALEEFTRSSLPQTLPRAALPGA